MCGIVGIVGRQEDAWLTSMNRMLRHRGPDDAGEYRDRGAAVALAMNRLSILDLERGHQPMVSRSGRTVIVFNGEIFNAPELRRRLEANGSHFISDNSDTEVLLELWEQKDERMLDDLNGMFAFVLYDRERGRVFGARDPLGIKPLYYAATGSLFAFASELKAFRPLPPVGRDVDHASVFHYISLRFVPGPGTILRGVNRLQPGHCFAFDVRSRELCVRRYWHAEFQPEAETNPAAWAERIREGLGAAVKRWVLSDVPVACSLSGGLDSSAIVALLAERGSRVGTYSLGFTGDADSEFDELPTARDVAARFATDHHEVVLDADDLLRDLLRMAWSLDEPYGGGLPSWYVFELMAKHVKVGLTGTGGDELFGDYGRFRGYELAAGDGGQRLASFAYRLEALTPRVAAAIRRMEARFDSPPAQAAATSTSDFSMASFTREYFDRFYYFTDRAKREDVFVDAAAIDETAATLARAVSGSHPRDTIAAVSMSTQLPDEFLQMTDRFSMAHSLEARVPFLDREFVDLMRRVPAAIRTRPHDLKYLLKRAVGDLLPPSVLEGRKKGFVLPTARWLRGPLRPLAERLLAPERLRAQGLFRPGLFDAVVRPHLDGRVDRSAQIWTLLMYQLWHAVAVENPSADAPAASWRDLC